MRYAKVDGPALRALRKKATNPHLERDLSLEAAAALIAKRLGWNTIHVTTLSKVETGERQPSPELFDAWCAALKGDRTKLVSLDVPPELAARVAEFGIESGAA